MSGKWQETSSSEKRVKKPTVGLSPSVHVSDHNISIGNNSRLPMVQRSGIDIQQMMPNHLLSLQRTVGNRTVQSLLQSLSPSSIPSRTTGPTIQRKMEVRPVDDRYEREADSVAAQLVSMSPSTALPIQRKEISDTIQREEDDELNEDNVYEYIADNLPDYEPTTKEIRKEIGIPKRLLYGGLVQSSRFGDWMLGKVTGKNHNARNSLGGIQSYGPLLGRTANLPVSGYRKAQSRLEKRHENKFIKTLPKNLQKTIRQNDKAASKDQKKWQRLMKRAEYQDSKEDHNIDF